MGIDLSIQFGLKYMGLDSLGTNQSEREVIWGSAELMYVQSTEVLQFMFLFEHLKVIKTLFGSAAQSEQTMTKKPLSDPR